MQINTEFFRGKTVLITGGTGSFGCALLNRLVQLPLKMIRVFSRDEYKQYLLQNRFTQKNIDWVLGDVRDLYSLQRACKGVDIVVHAAALKHVPFGELHPWEFIQTNIQGTYNLITAAQNNSVSKVLLLSTTKAVSPSSLYGSTKLSAEKLFIDANRLHKEPVFSIVRFGNLFGASGSIVPHFLNLPITEPFPVTHPNMTRFSITLAESVEYVLYMLEISEGGEILAPNSPTYRVIDLAKAIDANRAVNIIGLRPNEKLHEKLINSTEALRVLDYQDYFIILPAYKSIENYPTYLNAKKVPSDFNLLSAQSVAELSIKDLENLILEYKKTI